MTSFGQSIQGRVLRLPPPQTWAQALKPIFEAVMNGLQAMAETKTQGAVRLVVKTGELGLADPRTSIWVTDQGPGLDDPHWVAFKQLDTMYRASIGGKGIGRLLWLAAFEKIRCSSTHKSGSLLEHFSFELKLDDENPIANEKKETVAGVATGFAVELSGWQGAYRNRLQDMDAELLQEALAAEFWSQLHLTPEIRLELDYNGEKQDIGDLIDGLTKRSATEEINDPTRGRFRLFLAECKSKITRSHKRNNILFAAAHHRSVISKALDDLLGIDFVSECDDEQERTVLVAVLEGEYLDRHVNQERTGFTFESERIEELIREVCLDPIKKFVSEAIEREKKAQAETLRGVLDEYPSLAIEPEEKLINKLQPKEKQADEIYRALSIHRYRADQRRRKAVAGVLRQLRATGDNSLPDDLRVAVKEHLNDIEQASERQLAEFVIRRHVLLDVLDELIQRRSNGLLALEEALHTLIIEPRQATIGKGSSPLAHDLWILDENLAFSAYVTSDKRADSIINNGQNPSGRPDVAIFDQVFAFGSGEPLHTIYLVEFKRPIKGSVVSGAERQINKYVKALRTGTLRSSGDRQIRMTDRPYFECYYIADIEDELADEVSSWARSSDGFGRVRQIDATADWRGRIEIVPWDRLVARARERNKAFFEHLGINNRTKR